MIKVEIGCIADFICENARFRGLVYDIVGDCAVLVVLGTEGVFHINTDCIVPVASSADYIKLCNPK